MWKVVAGQVEVSKLVEGRKSGKPGVPWFGGWCGLRFCSWDGRGKMGRSAGGKREEAGAREQCQYSSEAFCDLLLTNF